MAVPPEPGAEIACHQFGVVTYGYVSPDIERFQQWVPIGAPQGNPELAMPTDMWDILDPNLIGDAPEPEPPQVHWTEIGRTANPVPMEITLGNPVPGQLTRTTFDIPDHETRETSPWLYLPETEQERQRSFIQPYLNPEWLNENPGTSITTQTDQAEQWIRDHFLRHVTPLGESFVFPVGMYHPWLRREFPGEEDRYPEEVRSAQWYSTETPLLESVFGQELIATVHLDGAHSLYYSVIAFPYTTLYFKHEGLIPRLTLRQRELISAEEIPDITRQLFYRLLGMLGDAHTLAF